MSDRIFFGPKFSGLKFFGPKFSGPKVFGPKFFGTKYFGPKFSGPKFFGPKFFEPKFFGPKFSVWRDLARRIWQWHFGAEGGESGSLLAPYLKKFHSAQANF